MQGLKKKTDSDIGTTTTARSTIANTTDSLPFTANSSNSSSSKTEGSSKTANKRKSETPRKSSSKSRSVGFNSSGSKSSSSKKRATPKVSSSATKKGKRKGPHVENRKRVKEYALKYRSVHGKWPTYADVQKRCKVGPGIVSEVMKGLKSSHASNVVTMFK